MSGFIRRQRLCEQMGRIDPKVPVFLSDLKSVLFDGVDEYVDCGAAADMSFDNTDVFTLSVWIKTTSSATEFVVSKAEASGNGRGWGMRFTSGKIYLNLANTTTTNHLQVRTTSVVINNGAWHNVIITYNGSSSASGVVIYKNSVSAALTTVLNTLNTTTVNAINAQISGRSGSNSIFNGKIDEVSVWNKEFSQDEITELYNSGSPTSLTSHSASENLVSWWRMGDGDTFPTLTDNAGTNDGTMTNMEAGDIVIDAP